MFFFSSLDRYIDSKSFFFFTGVLNDLRWKVLIEKDSMITIERFPFGTIVWSFSFEKSTLKNLENFFNTSKILCKLKVHLRTPTLYIRYPKIFFRGFPRLSVLRCKDKIEFKIFFTFVTLYSNAWFNRLEPSNFYFINLFFL